MAYTPPTEADFLARFPEFDGVPTSLLQPVLDEAQSEVGERWGTSRKTATLYLTAHILASEGGQTRAQALDGQGAVVEHTVDGESTKWASATAQRGEILSSPYGQRFDQLRRRVFAGSVFAV